MHDLDHPVLAGAENTNGWHSWKWDLHRPFPLNVPMVPSSPLAITSDGECLMCGCFSLGKTICPGSFEFIANYFRGLSLSPRRGNSRTAFMGSIHSGTWYRTPLRSSSWCQVGKGAPASRLRPLPSQPHHGWRMLWPPKPRWWFHCGQCRHGQIGHITTVALIASKYFFH
jgi:hypothetical protein